MKWLWNHRTAFMSVAQISVAQLATADLVAGTGLKIVLYVNGVLTGIIALHNTLKERRKAKETSQ